MLSVGAWEKDEAPLGLDVPRSTRSQPSRSRLVRVEHEFMAAVSVVSSVARPASWLRWWKCSASSKQAVVSASVSGGVRSLRRIRSLHMVR